MSIAPDLDALLEALDSADTAVREIYRKIADDPDLADEYEAGLRDPLGDTERSVPPSRGRIGDRESGRAKSASGPPSDRRPGGRRRVPEADSTALRDANRLSQQFR